MKVALYARVSTADKNQNPELQLNELRNYCEARKWTVFAECVDHGVSGATDNRAGLKNLLELSRSRKIDVVVVTKLDRMARSLKHLISMLDELHSLGVMFVSLRDQIDLTTASGRLMLHLLGAFAEFERSLIRDRTLAGLAFARSKGKVLGRPKKRNDEQILALRSKGFSYSQIQRELGISRPSVHRAIKAGGTQSPAVSLPNCPIISNRKKLNHG